MLNIHFFFNNKVILNYDETFLNYDEIGCFEVILK